MEKNQFWLIYEKKFLEEFWLDLFLIIHSIARQIYVKTFPSDQNKISFDDQKSIMSQPSVRNNHYWFLWKSQ